MATAKHFSSGLQFTDAAKDLCFRHAKGRALVLEFRELSPGGCCAAGAVIRLNWRPLSQILHDANLVSYGEVQGVPIYLHRVMARFASEQTALVKIRRFGPFRWLALETEKDPAMWCYFGAGPFS